MKKLNAKRTVKGVGKLSCEISCTEKKFSNGIGKSMDEITISIKLNKPLLWQPHSDQSEEFLDGIESLISDFLEEYRDAQLSN